VPLDVSGYVHSGLQAHLDLPTNSLDAIAPAPAHGAQILTDVLLDRAKSSATFFNGQRFPKDIFLSGDNYPVVS